MANLLNCNMPMMENRRFSQSLQLSPNQCATHFPEPTNVDLESAQPRPPVPAAAPFTVGSAEKYFHTTFGIANIVYHCMYDHWSHKGNFSASLHIIASTELTWLLPPEQAVRVVVVTHGTNNIWTQGLDRQEPIVVGGTALRSKKGIYIGKVIELANL